MSDYGQVAAAAAPVILSLIGQAQAAGDDAKVEELMRQAVAEYGPEILPHLEKLGATEYGNIQGGPGRDAQLRALQALEHEYSSGGLTPEDQAAYESASQNSAGFERGQRGALQTRMASRGISGGGMDLASQLAAQQGGVQRQHDAGVKIAGDSRMRALKALEAYGGVAGDVRSGDYRAGADRAAAQDAINKFNQGLSQKEFDNRMDVAHGRNDARTGLSGMYGGRAQRTRDTWGGIGKATGKAISAYDRYGGDGTDTSGYPPTDTSADDELNY